jgi:hypothetical protein
LPLIFPTSYFHLAKTDNFYSSQAKVIEGKAFYVLNSNKKYASKPTRRNLAGFLGIVLRIFTGGRTKMSYSNTFDNLVIIQRLIFLKLKVLAPAPGNELPERPSRSHFPG